MWIAWLKKVLWWVGKEAAEKWWKKALAKFAARWIPILWRWLMAYGVYSVASEAYELDQACRWWVDLEWYTPYYYC